MPRSPVDCHSLFPPAADVHNVLIKAQRFPHLIGQLVQVAGYLSYGRDVF